MDLKPRNAGVQKRLQGIYRDQELVNVKGMIDAGAFDSDRAAANRWYRKAWLRKHAFKLASLAVGVIGAFAAWLKG